MTQHVYSLESNSSKVEKNASLNSLEARDYIIVVVVPVESNFCNQMSLE
jgi:hypothetical protein